MKKVDQARKLAEEVLGATKARPSSIVKNLFFGRFSGALPAKRTFSAVFEEKLHALKQFAVNEIDAAKIDREQKIPDRVIRGLGSLGLLGFTIPKEYGGGGGSQAEYCRLMEELGGICGSTAIFVNAHQSIGLKAILLFGTEKQKKEWLPRLASGEKIAAFSLTEPMAGSDAGGIQTKAIFDSKKELYVLNGNKQWTTNGSIASVLTVMAKTLMPNGEEKVSAFLVPSNLPGFKITAAALEKVGIRGTRTTNLTLDNVEVPKENVLGQLGSGLRICLTALDFGRTTFGATCTGVGKRLLAMAKKQAIERIQFGHPIAHFEMVKEKLSKIEAYLAAMDASTSLTAALIDQGQEDVMLEAAILKVFASESLWEMIYETMQIYGGRSFFTDLPLERWMRDARLNMIGEGANEVLRVFIGAVGLREVGLTLKQPKHWGSFFFSRSKKIESSFPRIAYELKIRIEKFHWQALYLLAKYREGIAERQFELNRLATKAISLYTLIALLWKGGKKEVVELYAQMAFERFDRPSPNFDDLVRKVSDELTGIF